MAESASICAPRRRTSPQRSSGPRAARVDTSDGAALFAAAAFRADPVNGFPPGTPEGFPTTVSTSGLLHFVSGAVAFLSLAVSCMVVGAALRRRGESLLAALSLVSGIIVAAAFVAPMFIPVRAGIAGIWLSVVVGWVWLAAVSSRLRLTA